jgi:hypothetical protein
VIDQRFRFRYLSSAAHPRIQGHHPLDSEEEFTVWYKTRDEILNGKTEPNNKDEDYTQMEEEMTSKSYLLTRLLQLKKEIHRFDDALDSIEKLVPNNEELEQWAHLQLPQSWKR